MDQQRADTIREVEHPGSLFPIRLPTEAEVRVLELVALGLSSKEIAERLWISRQGVTYHIGNLFTKLRADSRAGLVSRAYAAGLLDSGSWPPHVRLEARPPVRSVSWIGLQRSPSAG